ncbi:MAG: hypothetical protein WC530_09560 [Candidatus Omnitrophota bacterium]|jgi:hypothetical protein
MTREELKAKIRESVNGEYREGGIVFYISEDKPNDIEAHDESIGRNGENALKACLLDYSEVNERWFLYGISSTEAYARQRDFLVRLSRIAGFNLGISDPVTIMQTPERVIEKAVQEVIPEETKVRVREADKLEGKVEAYEKLFIGRTVHVEGMGYGGNC